MRETPEDLCERQMRREIRATIPLVFSGNLILIIHRAFRPDGFVKGLHCRHYSLFPLPEKAVASLSTHHDLSK